MKSPRIKGALLALTLGLVPAASAQVAPNSAESVPLTRESTLTLPFDVPAEAREAVLAHTLPAGATYLPGSAALNGTPLADPAVGSAGRLYWTLPASRLPGGRGVLTYRVSHAGPLGALPAPGLLARYDRERREVLSGRVDAADLATARVPASAAAAENAGFIRLPLAGTVYRDRDRITVAVEGPLGGDLTLGVNGVPVPESSVGRRTIQEGGDGAGAGTERREYVGVKLAQGENRLTVGGETVRVFYAGPTTRVEVTGLQLLADGSTPVRVRLRALDALGLPTAQPFVTVRPSLEPLTPDANPQEVGHQVRLTQGEGVLELRPQALPTRLALEVSVGDRVQREVLDVTPDRAEVGVGYASVTFGVRPFGVSAWQAAGYSESLVGEGKLYLSVNSAGLPSGENPNTRFATYGDASQETVPLQGADPVAFRYEHPDFSVGYRQGPLPVDVLPVPGGFTALTASTRGDTRVSGFAALIPEEQVRDVLTPDGTRLYRLTAAPVSPDSETVQVVTAERGSGKELSRVTLVRGADYTLDPETGVLTLVAPLSRVDPAGGAVTLEVAYRTAAPLSNRALAWGAQVTTGRGPLTAGAAVVQMDGTLTAGARVAYADGTATASAAAAYSGGVQLSADAATRLGDGTAVFKVRYQDGDYAGLGAFQPGLTASAGVALPVTKAVGVAVDGTYHARNGESGGSVTGVVKVAQGPLAASAGLRAGFGSEAGVTAVGSVGLRGPRFGVDVAHTQPFGEGAATTSIGTSFALTPTLTLTARNQIDWEEGQRPSVGLSGRLGGVNFSANYDLPTASGDGNRARFGVDTSRRLTDKVSVGLAVTEIYDFGQRVNEFSVSPAVRYQGQAVSAALGADFAVRAGVLKTVLRGGLTVSASERLTLGADGLVELGATPGSRFGLSGAYRSGTVNGLGYLRYQTGSLAGGRPELIGEVQAELSRATWAVRAGLAGRELLNDPGSLTLQPSVGATAYLGDRLGLGLAARALVQPSSGSVQYGFGIEGSLRALPGTWLTLGYNPLGFEGIGNSYSKQGAYVRVGVLLDEGMGGRK